MKAYGLTKEHLDILRSALGKVFNKDSHVKVFLFGSRATGKHKQYSDVDLAFKSKDKELDSKLGKLQEILEESDLPCKVDLVRWDNLVEAYIPQIKKQKIPFWSPDDIELTSPWRICPLGKHWVRRHDRLLKTGTIVDQDGHCRKNRSHKDILQGDEIDLISNMQIFKNPPVRASNNDLGFKDVGNQYNDLISGWVAYWNYALKPKNPLHPNDLKALIASESGFKINAQNPNKTKKVGFARGLVQLTEQTYRILQNEKGELKDHLVILDKEEIWEPNKNICAAVRWLYRKYQTAQNKLKRNPTWEETFWEYKGILKQNNKDALTLKKRLKKFLEMISEGQNLIQK